MRISRWSAVFALALCALVCTLGVGAAAGTQPVEGAWKGKTKQGFFVYFGVREGVVANVRLTYREPICGEQSVHRRKARLSIDESGHFAGALVPERVDFEGSFVAPGQVTGKIISHETTGLPGCLRKVVSFTARPLSG
jgi:hypothetical protein